MNGIVSSASMTCTQSVQRSSSPSFVQTSLAIAMFSALSCISLSASALTLDSSQKTVTVNEDHTIAIVQDSGSSLQVKSHARLFSSDVLAESDSSSSATPAASQPEASGFTLNIQDSVICPQGTSEMACPVGAARIEHIGQAVAKTNDNTVTLSGNAELKSEVEGRGAALYAGYIEIGDRTNSESMAGQLTSNRNRIEVNEGFSSQDLGDMVAGYVYARDFARPGAQTGTLEATVTNNEVVINGGTFHLNQSQIAGGYASLIAKNAVVVNVLLEDNSVTIKNINEDFRAKSISSLYGAFLSGASDTGNVALTARRNHVTIEGGTFGGFSNGIVGAKFSSDPSLMDVTSENNSVTINGGTFRNVSYINGTYIYQGRHSTTLTGNEVTIKGGDFSAIPSITYQGGYVERIYRAEDSSIVSNDNKVSLEGGQGQSASLYGTLVVGKSSTQTLNGNIATLQDGTWKSLSMVAGAYSGNAISSVTANNNKAMIMGGNVAESIHSVRGASFYLIDGPKTVVAQNNEVLLQGSVPIKEVAAVYAQGSNLSEAKVTFTNNKVTLSGTPGLENANLYGAYIQAATLPTTQDVFSGNTLFVNEYTGSSKLNTIANFEHFDFMLPTSHVVNESIALKTATLYLDNPTNPDQHASIRSVGFSGEPRILQTGDRIYLIEADTITGTLANKDATLMVDQGVTVSTRTLVRQDPTQIYLEVDKPTTPTIPDTTSPSDPSEPTNSSDNSGAVSEVKPTAKTFSEAYLAGALAGVRAGDLVAGQAMTEAKLVKDRFAHWKGFGIASGIRGKYRTGSHIDTKDTSLIAGLLRGVQFDASNLTLGVFFEAGRSRYDTHNDVAEGGHGRGTVKYTGAGALVRLDAHNGLYAEASVRAGNARNEFDSSLVDTLGRTSSYNVHSNYFGFHLGAGYEWQVNEKLGGEVYTKYLFTRLDGDDVTTTTDDLLSFDSVTSQRLRVGGRVAYQMSERLTPYVGLGVEREFSAKSKATAFGLPISAPSLTGTSGMAEVGLKLLEPKGQYGWSADVNLRGYFGTRQEIGGNIRVGYKF